MSDSHGNCGGFQVRLGDEVRHNLDRYAEFIDANASYVVSETLKLLFRKHAEFKSWSGQHTNNHNQQQVQGGRYDNASLTA